MGLNHFTDRGQTYTCATQTVWNSKAETVQIQKVTQKLDDIYSDLPREMNKLMESSAKNAKATRKQEFAKMMMQLMA